MKICLVLLSLAFVLASVSADGPTTANSSPLPSSTLSSTSQAQPSPKVVTEAQSPKPVAPATPQLTSTEVKPPEVQAKSQSLVAEEPKVPPTDLKAKHDTPINPAPLAANNTLPSNSTTDASTAAAGMSLGTMSLIVVCVLAVVIISVGLLQYLLKARRNRA